MHSTLFHLKHAHHRALAYSRKKLAPYKITPARFDFLFMLHAQNSGMYQSDLVVALGCVKSNVTRLRDALIELGYVAKRFFATASRRGIVLDLTSAGRKLVKRILERTHDLVEEKTNACALAPPAPENETPKDGLTRVLRAVRAALGDRCLFDIYDPFIAQRLNETLILVRRKRPWEIIGHPKRYIYACYYRRVPLT